MGQRVQKPPRKLAVKKETLRKLDAQELKQAAGGMMRPTTNQSYTCAEY